MSVDDAESLGLEAVVALVEAGETIVLTRDDRPVAVLLSPEDWDNRNRVIDHALTEAAAVVASVTAVAESEAPAATEPAAPDED